jgi:hypothetical protein
LLTLPPLEDEHLPALAVDQPFDALAFDALAHDEDDSHPFHPSSSQAGAGGAPHPLCVSDASWMNFTALSPSPLSDGAYVGK